MTPHILIKMLRKSGKNRMHTRLFDKKGQIGGIKFQQLIVNSLLLRLRIRRVHEAIHWRRNLKFLISFLMGMVSGSIFLALCHHNFLHDREFLEKFLIPFCDMGAAYSATLNHSRDRIIWTDPIIGLGMIIVICLNLFVSSRLLFDKPITDTHMCILWAILGWELMSCGYCFGYLTDDYWMVFSICPDISYPRVGLIVLIFINLAAISIQHRVKKKWATILVVFLATSVLMLILSVLVIMTGGISHH